MIMSTIVLILFATLCVNADRQNSARHYAQKPRGQMGFKWTRQYARQGFGSSNYGNPINAEQPQPQYPYGKGTAGAFGNAPPSNTDEPTTTSTENTESTTSSGSTEEPVADPTSNTQESSDEIYPTNTNTDEPETIMNCLNDKCAESFNACFNDEQCKEMMEEWQETKSLKSECLPTYTSQDTDMPSSTYAPETEEESDEVAFATTANGDFESTENTESTTSTTYDYDENSSTSSTENTENTYDEDAEPSFSYSSTETEYSTSTTDGEQEPECEYNELFFNAYNCGVENYCYADQLKLAQSHQYLVQSPSNYRVEPNVTGSKSSSNGSTLAMIAVTAGIAAIILFEVSRRLYAAFQDKIQCQCSCVRLNNGLRYIKNKLEQVRGYKYEKTHGDLDTIEESDDMGMYGTSSDKDESITKDTTGVTYNGPLNDDSDCSDDIELQKTDDDNINVNDDQFVHNNDTVSNEEEKDTEEQEITVEAVQEPIQEL